MFANEKDVINLIKVDKQEKTADEIITEYKKNGLIKIYNHKNKIYLNIY